MKKQYEMPTAERIAFDYREQVVATSGEGSPGGNRTQQTMQCYVDFRNMIALGYDFCGRF